ncbi:MAG: hypothetical protein DRH30_03220 [Deltaproteobacteria bacterium]|nr:MAG: hypothetical protein DRH30_03220 [Deltaproteobacteria bacterium]
MTLVQTPEEYANWIKREFDLPGGDGEEKFGAEFESKHPRDADGEFARKGTVTPPTGAHTVKPAQKHETPKPSEVRTAVVVLEKLASGVSENSVEGTRIRDALIDMRAVQKIADNKKRDPIISDDAPHGSLGRKTNENGKPMSGLTLIHDADTSQAVFKTGGVYTGDRVKLHKKWEDGIFEGSKKPTGQPVYYMMGGGTASGKSSSLTLAGETKPENSPTIDSDSAKTALPELHDLMEGRDHRAAGWVHEESSDMAASAVTRAFDEGVSMTMDGTGDSGFEKLSGKLKRARDAGYRIKANYVTIPIADAISRSAKRAAESPERGMVPEPVIRGTHTAVSAVMPRAMEAGLYDEVKLWNNNVPRGDAPGLVMEHTDGETIIHDQVAWDRFKAKARSSEQ